MSRMRRRRNIKKHPRNFKSGAAAVTTLDAEQAAELLHLNVKRVQGLARAGKLPASRIGRKWLFRREELEALLGRKRRLPARSAVTISARNHLRGTVSRLEVEGLMAEVQIRIGDQELVSVITSSSAR